MSVRPSSSTPCVYRPCLLLSLLALSLCPLCHVDPHATAGRRHPAEGRAATADMERHARALTTCSAAGPAMQRRIPWSSCGCRGGGGSATRLLALAALFAAAVLLQPALGNMFNPCSTKGVAARVRLVVVGATFLAAPCACRASAQQEPCRHDLWLRLRPMELLLRVAAAQGDAYVIGLALFPGGNASNIQLQIAAASPLLGLCNTTLQSEMVGDGAASAARALPCQHRCSAAHAAFRQSLSLPPPPSTSWCAAGAVPGGPHRRVPAEAGPPAGAAPAIPRHHLFHRQCLKGHHDGGGVQVETAAAARWGPLLSAKGMSAGPPPR